MSRFPLPEDCDQTKPEEAFQWAFVALPFTGSTPLLIDPNVRPEWSKLFWDLGFRHHPELQTMKVRPPVRGQQHVLNGMVEVVERDSPEPPEIVIQDPETLARHEQEVVAEKLRYLGVVNDRPSRPALQKARVRTGPLFDPAEHSPSTVKGYLMGQDEPEIRRVIAKEQTGKARGQILNDPRWKGM